MNRTILASLDGFTPVIDKIVHDAGLMPAVVFGKVWRYCQMSDGVCTASHKRLAEELKISTSTLDRHLAELVSAGYLLEIREQGSTNTYKDTGLASLQVGITATPSKMQIDPRQNEEGTHVKMKRGSLQNEEGPSANCRPKIDIKKESKREVEYVEGDPDDVFPRMQHLCERLIGRLSTPADIPTIEVFLREGITEEDIQGALAWRVSQKLKPAANIRQLEAGVLRNKAARVQAASAASKKPSAKPTTLSDALKRLEGEIHVPEESSEIPSGPHSRLP